MKRWSIRLAAALLFQASTTALFAETEKQKTPRVDLILSADAGRVMNDREWEWKQSFPAGLHVESPEVCTRGKSELCGKAAGIALLPLEADSKGANRATFLPGSDLAGDLRFCPGGECRVVFGRSTAGFSDGARSALSHGPLTGLHLIWKSGEFGEIRLTPLHRPDLAGRMYDEGDIANAPRFRRAEGPGGPETYGHDAAFISRLGAWDIAGRFGTLRQKSTQSPFRRRDEDNLEYLGASAGWTGAFAGWLLTSVLSAEKVTGSYASLNFDSAGSTRRRIDGFAVETSFGAAGHGLSFEFRAFLPEPARRSRGSKPASEDTSGYVGFGERLLQSPLLAARMNFSPVPTLCGDRPNCTGITGARGESDFQSHAVVLSARIGLEVGAFEILFTASLFRPVAYGVNERRPAKIGPDPSQPAFLETGLELRTSSASGAIFSVGAGRVMRRAHADQPAKLKGENYHVSIAFPL